MASVILLQEENRMVAPVPLPDLLYVVGTEEHPSPSVDCAKEVIAPAEAVTVNTAGVVQPPLVVVIVSLVANDEPDGAPAGT